MCEGENEREIESGRLVGWLVKPMRNEKENLRERQRRGREGGFIKERKPPREIDIAKEAMWGMKERGKGTMLESN